MSAGNFTFLQPEFAAIRDAATQAEAFVHADPRTACFYARRALELAERRNVPLSRPAASGAGQAHPLSHYPP
jgi:hypothetical protein